MYDPNNIFAKIISGLVATEKIYEDDEVIAINDIKPVAPIHVLVIPKGAYMDYSDFVTKASKDEVAHYFTKIAEIASKLGLEKDGYQLVIHKGAFSGQTVFHFHTHIIGGKEIKAHC
jgi:histidine triad (HIT) family protein